MSAQSYSSPGDSKDPLKEEEKIAPRGRDISPDEVSETEGIDILATQAIDPVLSAKMHIVNNVSEHFQRCNL